jgi:hypothetical protein
MPAGLPQIRLGDVWSIDQVIAPLEVLISPEIFDDAAN